MTNDIRKLMQLLEDHTEDGETADVLKLVVEALKAGGVRIDAASKQRDGSGQIAFRHEGCTFELRLYEVDLEGKGTPGTIGRDGRIQ